MKAALLHNRSDEWYTPIDAVRTALEIFPPKEGDRVLLPFDTEKSNFTKVVLSEYDPLAIYNITNFMTEKYKADYIITNPPYSMKDDVIKRCIELSIPSVLILPIDTLGGIRRHKLFAKTNIEIYIPTKRIKFINEFGDKKKSPAFHSIIMKINACTTGIRFEYEKENRNGKYQG